MAQHSAVFGRRTGGRHQPKNLLSQRTVGIWSATRKRLLQLLDGLRDRTHEKLLPDQVSIADQIQPPLFILVHKRSREPNSAEPGKNTEDGAYLVGSKDVTGS